MDLDFLKNIGISPEKIEELKQANIGITTAEGKSNMHSLDGPTVIAIELATNNGTIRDTKSCIQAVNFAIRTHKNIAPPEKQKPDIQTTLF